MTHRTSRLLVFLSVIAVASSSAQQATAPSHDGFRVPTRGARQLILVSTPEWDEITGTIRTYERTGDDQRWVAVSRPKAMTLGGNGLGWGRGLHGGRLDAGPVKREGDDRSPAGVFSLGALFGYAPRTVAQRFHMPYVSLDSTYECVDDPSSMYYNMIVDRSNVRRVDWNSSEHMRFAGRYYSWGLVVEHNKDPRIAGDGSCIFLHIWGGADAPTSGCSSLDEEGLLEIMEWLDPAAQPVLVQLPQAEYERYSGPWKLP